MKQRVLTAIFALLIFIPILLYGDIPFQMLIYIMATIALYEFIKMRHHSNAFIPFIFSFLVLWFILIPHTWNLGILNVFNKTDVIILFVLLLLGYSVFSKNKFTFDDAGFVLLSTIFVGIGFFYFANARVTGLSYILYALFVIWATDTGAYLFGRAFGKRKLWPEISPNKTIGGALGGIMLACIVGITFQLISPFSQGMLYIVCITLLISVFGQIGDLVESAFKRHYNVKDSGHILPGHGGILDRFDSLIFILPLLHFLHFI